MEPKTMPKDCKDDFDNMVEDPNTDAPDEWLWHEDTIMETFIRRVTAGEPMQEYMGKHGVRGKPFPPLEYHDTNARYVLGALPTAWNRTRLRRTSASAPAPTACAPLHAQALPRSAHASRSGSS